MRGAPAVRTGRGRKRRGHFLDHGSLHECGLARCGKYSAQFFETQRDNFLPRARSQAVRRADDQLQILPAIFLRSPPESCVLLNTHCVVLSSSVRNGSLITVRSNQRCTPVIGEAAQIAQVQKHRLALHNFRGQQFRQDVLRHRGEIIVRRFHRAVFPFHSLDPAISQQEIRALRRATELPLPARRALCGSLRTTRREERAECRRDIRRASRETLSRTRRSRSAHRCDPVLHRAR